MTTVSSPKVIAAPFANAHDDSPFIIGKTYDDDMQRLRRRNFQALQDIDIGDGTNATGLIFSEVDHKLANKNQAFDHANRALEAYKPSIQDNDNSAVRIIQEKNWSRKLNCQAAIRTAERVGKKFVLSRVKNTWVVCLKNENTLCRGETASGRRR